MTHVAFHVHKNMKIFEKIKGCLSGHSLRSGTRLSEEERGELIRKMRTTEVFAMFSEEMITKLLDIMEPLNVRAGDAVVRQDDEGDYYYLLVRGSARVLQRSSSASPVRVVAEINAPASIGEDALISNAKRNATVIMNTAGLLLRLGKEDFNTHIRNPILRWVSPSEALKLVNEGAKWLDVREKEKTIETLQGSINIPFSELRGRISELDRETFYLCYCDNGRLGATAAFLLCQRGLKAGVLRGGLIAFNRSRTA